MQANRKSVLIVEDQRELAVVVKRHLAEMGFDVQIEGDGLSGIRALEARKFDLVLLDLMLPGVDGLEVCRRLRRQASYVPIIMLTAKSSELDKVVGLEMGADDYLTKPFSIKELLARVKALLRRMEQLSDISSESENTIELGTVVTIDPGTRQVLVRGKAIDLTNKEFDLFLHFARNPGRVYSRAQLLDAVWGYSHDGYDHAVNCHINRLRAKIERDHRNPEIIETVWGVGYRLTHPASDEE